MKGILYFFWGSVLLGILHMAWFAAGFKPVEELGSQLQHWDDYMNARGQYGDPQP